MTTPDTKYRHALLALVLIIQGVFASVAQAVPVERDFDTIRDFNSFDPATQKWSKVEDFDTVEILDDPTEYREDHYIYHDFWAYDAVTRRWRKVDIRGYGYKRRSKPKVVTYERVPSPPQEQVVVVEQPRPSKKTAPFNFLKNLTLGLRGGGGVTFYMIRMAHLGILEHNERGFFLYTDEQNKAYIPRWFGKPYERPKDKQGRNIYPTVAGMKHQQNATNYSDGDQKNILRGEGFNIPVTMFMHYTFSDRIRLGGGGVFEVNHLRKMRPIADASKLGVFQVASENEWFYNLASFGLLGLNLLHAPHQNTFLDLQVGCNWNIGVDFKEWFDKRKYIFDGWLFGAGISHERKINSYFKWIIRLGADWKISDDTPQGIDIPEDENEDRPFLKVHQIATYANLGLQVNFGDDDEAAQYETEYDKASAQDDLEAQRRRLGENRAYHSKSGRPARFFGE